MFKKLTPILVGALLLAVFALVGLAAGPAAAKPNAKPSPTPVADPSSSPSPTASVAPSATPSPTANPGDPQAQLMQCMAGMSKLQTLVEFFYINTGTYPANLAELDAQYNERAPRDAKKVAMPLDPATGKPFLYEAAPDASTYVIKPPAPEKYGVKNLQLTPIDWGWMNSIALDHKRVQLIELCTIYIRGLAASLDQFARDNKNALPDSLDVLVPKYVKKMPVCPVCGKPYVYKHDARGYEVGCPDAHSHDLEVLYFSSTEGLKRR